MFKWLKREFFGVWSGFRDWVNGQDQCEICGEAEADYICVGCDKRICSACDSGYYADAELCTGCRVDISPEQEEQDRKEAAQELAEQCTCPAPCDLDKEDHEFIAKYLAKKGQ